jgi:hypothetical protein
MTPKVWGPPVWIFLHTFTVNISEIGYNAVGMQFYAYLTRICRLLPCPECAEHATKFISSVKQGTLKTKYDMANMLCNFHNMVNNRKRLPKFDNRFLTLYEKVSIVTAFNNFVQAFTISSQRMMNDNLHRKMLVSQINKFLTNSLIYFIKPVPSLMPQPQLPIPTAKETTEIEENITYEVVVPTLDCIKESDFVEDEPLSIDSRDICVSIVENCKDSKEDHLSTIYETDVEEDTNIDKI